MSEKGLRGGGKVGGRRKSERAAEDYAKFWERTNGR